MTVDTAKNRAAVAAVSEIESGMLVGLGTGSTAAFAIAALGDRIRAEGLSIQAVCTSIATETAARAAGIALRDFAKVARIDLAIDGADEIDSEFQAIKGGGGAMLREKIVAASAKRMLCIVDDSKVVFGLGARPLPIEVLPFAEAFVSEAIRALDGEPVLRRSEDGQPARSDQGNLLIDCRFGSIPDPRALAQALDPIPGLLGHGLFLDEIDVLYIGREIGVDRRERINSAV